MSIQLWLLEAVQSHPAPTSTATLPLPPSASKFTVVGDSEMPRYTPHCHVAEECRSIAQLSKVVDLIVP